MGNSCESKNNRIYGDNQSGSTAHSSKEDCFFNQNIQNNFQMEKYYGVIKDSNVIDIIKGNNSNQYNQRIEIFFSLINALSLNSLYSFSLTVINNANIGINSYLGALEERQGNNISFGNSFMIDYFPDRQQILVIKPIINKKEIDFELRLTVSELLKNQFYQYEIPNVGTIELTYAYLDLKAVSELEKYYSKFTFEINILNDIFNIDGLSSNQIYFIINQFKDSDKKRPIYKSKLYNIEIIKTKEIKIEMDYLCYNLNDNISIEFYSVYRTQRPFAKGTFSLYQLISNSSTEIELKMNHSKVGNCIINYNIEKKISFAEKLSNKKMQINLEIAIDYTASNKPPENPKSNHYLDLYELNDYEKAMKYCCEILAPYDADQLFPVYGFGGIPSVLNGIPNENNNKPSHCFNINFDEDAEIQGIDNILKIYRESLRKIKLSGNTKLGYILKKVMKNINYDLKNKKYENHYYILLILTDGQIDDIKETKDLIVEASHMPLSIVLVGIGGENFAFMENLDGDKIPLINSRGIERKRDIVQFIEFNKFKNYFTNNFGNDFAEEVLKEIPRQIDEYYRFCGHFY